MNKNMLIIIGLVIVIVALLVGIGVSMLGPAKEDVKLTITSNDTIYEGDSIEIKLTDINDTPITGETVNISITDDKGTTDYHSVSVNENGTGDLALDKSSGNYTVNCTYGGNEKYFGNSTSKKISIVAKEEVSYESASTSQSSKSASGYGSYINDEWVSMSEQEYAERYPALYHQQALSEGKYDQYHPQMYDIDRENGWI